MRVYQDLPSIILPDSWWLVARGSPQGQPIALTSTKELANWIACSQSVGAAGISVTRVRLERPEDDE